MQNTIQTDNADSNFDHHFANSIPNEGFHHISKKRLTSNHIAQDIANFQNDVGPGGKFHQTQRDDHLNLWKNVQLNAHTQEMENTKGTGFSFVKSLASTESLGKDEMMLK